MRTKLIAGNWKMNKTQADAKALVKELLPMVKKSTATVVLCVPYLSIDTVSKLTKGSVVKVGSQNIAWADSGAFTGEISAAMQKECGVEYAVIGHSERRQYFGETDETVCKRTVQALKNGITPIVCVGESEQQKEAGQTNDVCSTQIQGAFAGIEARDAAKCIVAYEPIWAIGTGKTATAEDANDTIVCIRAEIEKLYDKETAQKILILYGGSMNAKNAEELLSKSDIDGGLIGGASLKAEDFAQIVTAANK
ncbi:MAG: triose-phosphate isomerase [Firmicutes bacterium]|nr:triose-phosphate isomerase [Bacillota bacterium]